MDTLEQPLPAPQVPPPASPPAEIPKRRRGLRLAILGISSLMLLAIAGAGAYFFYMHRPQQVLKRSLLAMSELDSVAYAFDYSQVVAPSDPNQPHLSDYALSANGAVEFTGAERQHAQFSLTANKQGEAILGPINGEFAHSNNITYVKFSDLVIPSFMGINSGDYTDILTGQWIRIDRQEILDSLKLNELNDKLEAAKNEAQDKYGDRPQEIVQEYLPRLLTIADTLPSETLDGEKTYHYAYTLNRDVLNDFETRLKSEFGDDLGKTGNQIDSLLTVLAESEGTNGEMWIGKHDTYLHKLTLSNNQTADDLATTLNFSVTLADFNVPVQVQAPATSSSLQEVLTTIVDKAKADAQLALSDDDNDGLKLFQEQAYGSDPANPDTDGDGFKDGDEVKAGYNPNGPGELPKVEAQKVF